MNGIDIDYLADGNSPIEFNYGEALLTQNGGWRFDLVVLGSRSILIDTDLGKTKKLDKSKSTQNDSRDA